MRVVMLSLCTVVMLSACGGDSREDPQTDESTRDEQFASPNDHDASIPNENPKGPDEPESPSLGSDSSANVPADQNASSSEPNASNGPTPMVPGTTPTTSTTPTTGASCSGSFCDGFESEAVGALASATWSKQTPNCSGSGKVSIDEQVSHSGKRSLRVDGEGGYCNHVFAAPRLPSTVLGSHVFVRFFVRMGVELPQSHVTFLAMHETSEGRDLRLGGQNGIMDFNRESDDATLPALSPTGMATSIAPAKNTWICVEFELDGDASQLRTWVDEKAISGLTVDGVSTPDVDEQWLRKPSYHPNVDDLRLGWESYGSGGNTVWFDDVAVGKQRLGCK